MKTDNPSFIQGRLEVMLESLLYAAQEFLDDGDPEPGEPQGNRQWKRERLERLEREVARVAGGLKELSERSKP